MVELLATVTAALIGAAVLLTRKAKLNRWATTAIWLGELTVVVVSFALIGWPGLVLALGVLVAALLATSVRLALHVESALVAATARGKLDFPRLELNFASSTVLFTKAIESSRTSPVSNRPSSFESSANAVEMQQVSALWRLGS